MGALGSQSTEQTLMLFSVVDDRCGVTYQEYRCVYGEDVCAALRFLFHSGGIKASPDFSMQGIPLMLYLDNGPIARSQVFLRVMRWLGGVQSGTRRHGRRIGGPRRLTERCPFDARQCFGGRRHRGDLGCDCARVRRNRRIVQQSPNAGGDGFRVCSLGHQTQRGARVFGTLGVVELIGAAWNEEHGKAVTQSTEQRSGAAMRDDHPALSEQLILGNEAEDSHGCRPRSKRSRIVVFADGRDDFNR
jgi:hypothetical protein